MDAAVKALYRGIMRELFNNGEATRTILGKEYGFSYSEFGTEITCNGSYFCEITQNWELQELLCDLLEAQFDS